MQSFIFKKRSEMFLSYIGFINKYTEFEDFICKNSYYTETLNKHDLSIKHLYHLLINLVNLLIARQSTYYPRKIFIRFQDDLIMSINQDFPSEITKYNKNLAHEIDFKPLINGQPFHDNFFYYLCRDEQALNYVTGIPDWFYTMYLNNDKQFSEHTSIFWEKYVYNTDEFENYKYKHKQMISEINYFISINF